MQISIEKNEGLERNVNVSIPAENIKSQVAEKLKEISKQVKIKGFRPGRVPNNILTQRYGTHARQEVLGDIMKSAIQQAVEENELSLVGTPEVTEAKDLDDGGYEFVAKLELMPEVPSIDYSKIVVKTETSEVDDKDVDKMIKKLQKQKQEWKDSKAKIAKGDLITINYSAKDGEKVVYPETGEEKMGILLGESGVPDELIKNITGKKSGESDSLRLAFPEEFNVKELAGNEVDFDFTIADHKRGSLPKVDEEFVKSFGVDSGQEDDLRNEIRENLKRELSNALQVRTKESVLEAIRKEVSEIMISDTMIDRESAALAQQSMEQAKQMGVENPELPDPKNFTEKAKERIVNSLVINNVAKEQSMQVDYTKVREKVIEVSQTFENPPQIVEYYYKTPELLASIENAVLENQVIDWITSQVEVEESPVSFDKLMNSAV